MSGESGLRYADGPTTQATLFLGVEVRGGGQASCGR